MIKTQTITLSSSPTTITIPVESSQDVNYIISGTHTMGGAISIAVTGQPTNQKLTFYYTATLSSYSIGSNYLQFPGSDKLPAEYAAKECKIECIYNGSSWKTFFFPDFTQTNIITGENILDGDIESADLASNAVIASKITDSTVTLVKIEDIPDDTILGNVSGGAAEPDALTATEVRTLLDQDVTLTGHVTGTATQTFGTGDTSVSTTIANNVITVGMLTTAPKVEIISVPISLEANALTGGVGVVGVQVGYDCTVEDFAVFVVSLVEATDDAVLTLYNNAGTLMTGSTVTVTKNTKPATTTPPTGSKFNCAGITANNSMTSAQVISIKVTKTTAGGFLCAQLKLKKS